MIALCVDDEALLLRALYRAVMKSPDISQAAAFDDVNDALEWAKTHEYDIAFLDIRMPGMDGLEMAEKLRRYREHCAIVFCTGHTEYAISAINLHLDCGYLTKPVEPELVQKEIDRIKKSVDTKRESGQILPVKVRCYGGFEVLGKDGKPLIFRRSRAKELFALLIDHRGVGISARGACGILFEEEDLPGQKEMNHFYKLIGEMKSVLDRAGYSKVIRKNGSNYYIEPSRIIIEDEKSGKERGLSYMEGYSWAM